MMSRSFRHIAALAGGFIVLAPAPLFAHPFPGTAHGWWDGLVHPFSGIDHLVTALAVGFLAARYRAFAGRAALGFLASAAVGWGLGLSFGRFSVLGGVLAGVVLVLVSILANRGLLIASAATAVAGVLGLGQGFGHAAYVTGSQVEPTAGWIVSTAGIVALGYVLGHRHHSSESREIRPTARVQHRLRHSPRAFFLSGHGSVAHR